jgi:hypothetical protein
MLEAIEAKQKESNADEIPSDEEQDDDQATDHQLESGRDKHHVDNPGGDLNEGNRRQHRTYAEKTTEMRYEVSHDDHLQMLKQLNVSHRIYYYDVMNRLKHDSGNACGTRFAAVTLNCYSSGRSRTYCAARPLALGA